MNQINSRKNSFCEQAMIRAFEDNNKITKARASKPKGFDSKFGFSNKSSFTLKEDYTSL